MKKLVIFDLDGTLIDSIEDLADSTNYALQQCGLPTHPVEPYNYFVGDGADMLIRRAMPQDKREDDVLFQKIKDIYMPYYQAHSLDKTRPYEGIEELLKRCNDQGVLIAVVSNKPHRITGEVVRSFFPSIRFAAAMGQRDDIPKKPDPAGELEVLRLTGIDKADALYVGDTCVDVMTGKNSGVAVCGVTWGFRPRSELEEHQADCIAENVEELSAFIFE